MTQTITLSPNELRALLFRYFEATFAHGHDFYDAAKIVFWLEMHKLGGISMLMNASSCESRHVELAEPVVYAPDTQHVFDFAGVNSVCGALIVADYAVAMTKRRDFSCAEIHNCDALASLLPLLVECAERTVSAYAFWNDGSQIYFAICKPMQSKPDLYSMNNSRNDGLLPGSGFLVCASNEEMITNFANDVHGINIHGTEFTKVNSTAQLAAEYNESIRNGVTIPLSDYQKLCMVADKILVEASEASRLGAGD